MNILNLLWKKYNYGDFCPNSLETEKADLTKQRDIFKNGIEELGNKFKKERQKYQNHAKTLEVKNAEILSTYSL